MIMTETKVEKMYNSNGAAASVRCQISLNNQLNEG